MPQEIALEIELDARPEETYQALTDGGRLKAWLADQAEVDLDEGRYGFWGRFVPDSPDEPRQSLRRFVPQRLLEYDWNLEGGLSRVRLELEAAGTGSILRLHQDSPETADGEASLADYWSLSFENLRRHLESGGPPVLCDFSVAARGQVGCSVEIKARRQAVYQALIDPAQLNRYIAAEAEVEPRSGGVYSFGWKGGGPVKILDLEADRKLSYSWNYHDDDTVVQWELEDSGGGTRLTVVHSGFADDRELKGYTCGWLNFMNRIKSLSEAGSNWQPPRTLATDCPEGV
ncbi:MAG TPA: SRPBCC family protein [Acidobacteriota bacterium]|nr:SRPBCC family protein [Acidobacteriota bacterium]